MKARIMSPEPPPDNRTPEEKAGDSRKARKLMSALMGFYAAVNASGSIKQEQEEQP